MIAASLAMLARSAPVRPAVWRAIAPRSTSEPSGLSGVWTLRIASRPTTSGGETKIWRSKRPGRSSAGSSFSSRLEAAMTTTSPLEAEAVHLDQELVERLLALGVVVRAALGADGVDLVDEDDRRRGLAGLAEQAPDARGAEAGEHLDEARGRLREELRAGLVGHGLGQQRLAGAGRAVQQDALGHLRAELAEALRVPQEVDDLLQLGLGLVGAGDLVPLDRAGGVGLDLLRLGLRHHLHRPPQEEDDQAHEDERPPQEDEALELFPHSSSSTDECRRTMGDRELGGLDPSSIRRAGSRRARRGRPRAGARPARGCRSARWSS